MTAEDGPKPEPIVCHECGAVVTEWVEVYVAEHQRAKCCIPCAEKLGWRLTRMLRVLQEQLRASCGRCGRAAPPIASGPAAAAVWLRFLEEHQSCARASEHKRRPVATW